MRDKRALVGAAMVIGVDPKVDYAFKWLFGSEKNTGILIHLLHSILNPSPEEQIVELQILNPFSEKMSLDEKLSILDIKARDQRGRQFNIEMQMIPSGSLRRRILYYWARLYTEQLQSGEDYHQLRPTLSVCFVDGIVFHAVSAYHLEFRLLDPEHGVSLSDDLRIHFFELPKFDRTAEELTTPLESWLYFLQRAEGLDMDRLPGPLSTPEIRQAMEALTMITQTDIQREIYEGRIKARRDERTRLIDAIEEGLAKGREQGLERGELIGRIRLLQEQLRQATIPREVLASTDLDELKRMEEELSKQWTRS